MPSISRIQVTFWFDLTLLLSMCALQSVTFTGLTVHEWLAIAVMGLILIHILLSWTWIAATSRRLAAPRSGRARVNYFLNSCLFVSAITVLFSGLVISEVVLPAIGITVGPEDNRWRGIHNVASTLVVIFAGLHLAINWEWSIAAAKRCLRIRAFPQ